MVRKLQQPGRNKEHHSHGSVGHGVLEDIRGLSLNGLLYIFHDCWKKTATKTHENLLNNWISFQVWFGLRLLFWEVPAVNT